MLQIYHFSSFFLTIKSSFLVKSIFLLNAAFAMAILGLISLLLYIICFSDSSKHSDVETIN
jgi:hypothetical protein